MDTVGSLLDKLSILEIRLEHISKDDDYDVFTQLNEQKGWIINEIAEVLYQCLHTGRPFTFKKHKLYSGGPEGELATTNIFDLISDLDKANRTLWRLEDVRRDKSREDSDRLKSADSVTLHNGIRNALIDEIDQYFAGCAHSRIFGH